MCNYFLAFNQEAYFFVFLVVILRQSACFLLTLLKSANWFLMEDVVFSYIILLQDYNNAWKQWANTKITKFCAKWILIITMHYAIACKHWIFGDLNVSVALEKWIKCCFTGSITTSVIINDDL